MESKLKEENMTCPVCGIKGNLYKIEDCESSCDEVKTSWGCVDCDEVIYIFEREPIKVEEIP